MQKIFTRQRNSLLTCLSTLVALCLYLYPMVSFADLENYFSFMHLYTEGWGHMVLVEDSTNPFDNFPGTINFRVGIDNGIRFENDFVLVGSDNVTLTHIYPAVLGKSRFRTQPLPLETIQRIHATKWRMYSVTLDESLHNQIRREGKQRTRDVIQRLHDRRNIIRKKLVEGDYAVSQKEDKSQRISVPIGFQEGLYINSNFEVIGKKGEVIALIIPAQINIDKFTSQQLPGDIYDKVSVGMRVRIASTDSATRIKFETERRKLKNNLSDTMKDISQTPEFKSLPYLKSIKGRIEKSWRYPEIEKRMNVGGKVTIEFSIDRKGNLKAVHIEEKSGYRNLDNAALTAIRQSAPFPPLPDWAKKDYLRVYARFHYPNMLIVLAVESK